MYTSPIQHGKDVMLAISDIFSQSNRVQNLCDILTGQLKQGFLARLRRDRIPVNINGFVVANRITDSIRHFLCLFRREIFTERIFFNHFLDNFSASVFFQLLALCIGYISVRIGNREQSYALI